MKLLNLPDETPTAPGRSLPPDVSEYKLRLVVVMVAFLMPTLVLLFAHGAGRPMPSISASFWAGDNARSVFVGSLYLMSLVLWGYQGNRSPRWELLLCRAAAVAALGVAMFPECQVDCTDSACRKVSCTVGRLHLACAGLVFGTLAVLCGQFWRRARGKTSVESQRRAKLYLACLVLIGVAMAGIALGLALDVKKTWGWPNFVYWFETLALFAFGVAWAVASKFVTWFGMTSEEEHRGIWKRGR